MGISTYSHQTLKMHYAFADEELPSFCLCTVRLKTLQNLFAFQASGTQHDNNQFPMFFEIMFSRSVPIQFFEIHTVPPLPDDPLATHMFQGLHY